MTIEEAKRICDQRVRQSASTEKWQEWNERLESLKWLTVYVRRWNELAAEIEKEEEGNHDV